MLLTLAFAAIGASPLDLKPTEETVIRLKVQPMAAPRPALRYLLLPELQEMMPGNPIEGYLSCFLEEDPAVQKDLLGHAALKKADRAARMDKPDWQILLKARSDGFNLLLPDVQIIRRLASSLQNRFRTELNQKHFDDAIATAKTMFALARHAAEHPTLIGDLVGIAIAHIAIVPLEEMLQQPGCPNLYWALTNLPAPFISIDRGLEGERMMCLAELSDLSETAALNASQLRLLIEHIDRFRDWEEKPRRERTRVWLDERLKDPVAVPAARKRLVEYGLPEERLLKFPPEQIVLLDEKRDFEERRDELAKLMKLATWQVEEMIAGMKPEKSGMLLGSLMAAFHKVRRAQGRLEQRVALLRHVEAIRLYAADHKGGLPEKLTDIAVPLPVDPFTGKPFRYSVEGNTAHVRGNPPPGAESMAAYNLHYEIEMLKP